MSGTPWHPVPGDGREVRPASAVYIGQGHAILRSSVPDFFRCTSISAVCSRGSVESVMISVQGGPGAPVLNLFEGSLLVAHLRHMPPVNGPWGRYFIFVTGGVGIWGIELDGETLVPQGGA